MSFIPVLTWKDIYLYCSSDSDDPSSEEDEDDDEGHHEDLVEPDFRKLEMERGEQKQEELHRGYSARAQTLGTGPSLFLDGPEPRVCARAE